MATALASITELKKMGTEDLTREARNQRLLVAKMRMGIKMGKEKDAARYAKEKKQLARMLTVLQSLPTSELKQTAKTARVPAPRKS
ncbi:MAG: 50S ribosomal protein L29 [Candidatus Peregrinibacteria bacterium]|nr:50S ribosomal protein L29 [Candidatus Peregrinibacteria bacterium]